FTVNPAPGMPTLDTKTCSGAISNIVLADNSPISVAATSYDINLIENLSGMVAGGSNATTGNTGQLAGYKNKLKNDVFTNSTNVTQIVRYFVVPVNDITGCKGPTTIIVLTVEPTIIATPNNTKPTICSTSALTSDPTNIVLTSPTIPSSPAVNPITFSYTASVLTGVITGFSPSQSGLSAGYVIADNLVNNTSGVATIRYMITPIANGASNGAGCIGVAVPVIVTVEPS